MSRHSAKNQSDDLVAINRRRDVRRRTIPALAQAGPVSVWMVLFVTIPMLYIIFVSFMSRGVFGDVVYEFSLESYQTLLDSIYFKVIVKSLQVALFTTIACLLLGYPFAYYIARKPPEVASKLIMLIMIPFWTNSLMRLNSWLLLFQTSGPVNTFLQWAGITSEPVTFIYTDPLVMLGLVTNMLPFAVLPLYSTIEKLQNSLLEASSDLGATPRQTFFRITLPLTFPGIFSAVILVFIPSLGIYTVSDMLGGGKVLYIGTLSLSLSNRTEQFHFFFYGCLDGLKSGSQQFSRVIAFALLILTSLDIFPGSRRKCQLALSIHIDLGYTQVDGLFDHVCRDSGTAVQNQRHISGQLLDGIQSLEAQSLPVFRIFAMDIADSGCQEVDTQISDHLALFGICALTHSHNAVFLAADGSNLCLQRHSMLCADLHQLFGLGHVFLDGIMGTIKHDGGEACLHTLQTSFIAAVIQMKRNRNRNVQLFQHTVHHSHNSFISCHILSCALGNSQDHRRVALLRGQQDGLGPLQVVDVKLAYCIMAGFCFF